MLSCINYIRPTKQDKITTRAILQQYPPILKMPECSAQSGQVTYCFGCSTFSVEAKLVGLRIKRFTCSSWKKISTLDRDKVLHFGPMYSMLTPLLVRKETRLRRGQLPPPHKHHTQSKRLTDEDDGLGNMMHSHPNVPCPILAIFSYLENSSQNGNSTPS